MTVPVTGLLLIPLGLLIALLPWRYCLIGLVTFAMMSPAAVVNVGSFGVQPGYFVALLLIGRTAVEIAVKRFALNATVLTRMYPLFLFLAIAFLVLFTALAFFQGRVETLPGTVGFKSNSARAFTLGRENFTQIAYLILNLCLVYALAHQGARRDIQSLLKWWDVAFCCGLGFAVAVCLWQFASFYAGVPFPSDFFYSNAGYSRSEGQTMAGLFRINGPFEEPSTVGYVFTGFILFAWQRYRLFPTALSAVMLAGCLFCMLVSTSTTAFFGLFVFGCVVLFDLATGAVHLFSRTLSRGQIAFIGLAAFGLSAGTMLAAVHWQAISAILQNTLFEKSESTSFQERSFADFLGLRIFVETYGIGIGLGSHKANSLALTLLSNLGIAGLALFASFLYTLLRASARIADSTLSRSILPFRWGLAGLIVIHIFSNPNLSTLLLWIQMGGLLSLQVAVRNIDRERSEALHPDGRAVAMRYAIPYGET